MEADIGSVSTNFGSSTGEGPGLPGSSDSSGVGVIRSETYTLSMLNKPLRVFV